MRSKRMSVSLSSSLTFLWYWRVCWLQTVLGGIVEGLGSTTVGSTKGTSMGWEAIVEGIDVEDKTGAKVGGVKEVGKTGGGKQSLGRLSYRILTTLCCW